MTQKEQLIKFFEDCNSIEETGLTWKEVGDKFNLTAEAARSIIRRHKQRIELSLVQVTEKYQEPVFEKYKKVPDSKNPDISNLKISKVTTNPYGGEWITYNNEGKLNLTKEDIVAVIKENNPDFKLKSNIYKSIGKDYQIINIADCHIGMDITNDLFDYKWNIGEAVKRMDKVLSSVNLCKHLIINQLGDFADNLNGYTARKDHKIPSNLSTKDIIKYGKELMIYFIDTILDTRDCTITINWLTNSNHAPLVDYAIGMIIASHYYNNDRVIINVIEEFIYHFDIEDTTYVVLHGKDESQMFKGLSKFLSEKDINYLNNIFKHKNLNNVVVLRGDQHAYHDIQYQTFRDILTPSFANPSSWIQYNFASDFKGGFTIIEVVDEELTCRLKTFK